jgi:uncharacterized membrane protein
MRTFLALLLFAVAVNVLFATLTWLFFRGDISGANNFGDYLHYAVGSITTSEVGNMVPQTTAAKLWTSAYVLLMWVYIFYVTVNHITNVKFGRLG